RKAWTDRAKGSSDADVFTSERLTYLAPTTLNTPSMPDADSGPEPACTGINVERDRDTAGYFRFSRMRVFFDTQYDQLALANPSSFELAQRETIERAMLVVNRVLDCYRFVTKEAHIQRLGSVYVTDLYYAAHNVGVHGANFGHGIGSAVMNRSERELERIAGLLKTGDDLPVPELLFLDSE